MELGKYVDFPALPALGLDATSADLPASDLRREVKIYKVPAEVSTDQYYISITDAGGVEEVPPSRSKDNVLLCQYSLGADGDVSIKYLHEELENA